MRKRDVEDWVQEPKNRQILHAFSIPKTPGTVKARLAIKNLTLKPFLEKGLIDLLNPKATKGRLYVLTAQARELLNLPPSQEPAKPAWDLLGWIVGSPRQRLAVLTTMAMDAKKRTSSEIMERTKTNSSITRKSIKSILKVLISKGLVETKLTTELRKIYRGQELRGKKLKREYWLSELGKSALTRLNKTYDNII